MYKYLDVKIKNVSENRFFNPLYVEKSISEILMLLDECYGYQAYKITNLNKKQTDMYYAQIGFQLVSKDEVDLISKLEKYRDKIEYEVKGDINE